MIRKQMWEVSAVPPDWCKRKKRFAESIDKVEDPSAIRILVVKNYI